MATLAEIQIRDPFLLHVEEESRYYLFGSTDPNIWRDPGIGFDTWTSTDLEHWEGPVPAFRPPEDFWSKGQYWAPEVHRYRDRWYMFATFTSPDGFRGTQVLSADEPAGPYRPWSDGTITPRKWQCLDGTLHVDDDGTPWVVFCQEWSQVHDGAIWARRLTPDLTGVEGSPVFLFNASDAPWTRPMTGQRFAQYDLPVYVTDGPFLFRLRSGHLMMLWSSFGDGGYAMGVAHSTSGHVTGPWVQEDEALWSRDGGHGMIARLADASLVLTLHRPNKTPDERAVFQPLEEQEDGVRIVTG